ncbi:MAG TPA: HAD family hydrolase [Candidatus Saccharimonadales bacterium]|nr:HAD family hydrolase [Candidatus Saccharimonadales bacterium]
MRQLGLGVIFDLDNTLYRLRSTDGTYEHSSLKVSVMQNARSFVAAKLAISASAAERLLAEMPQDDLSLVFEAKYGIDRYEWFQNVWNVDPKPHIVSVDRRLPREIAKLKGRCLLLTSAPQIWVRYVLRHLGLTHVFIGGAITGEPDLRKPDQAVFLRAATLLRREPSRIVSIGDQNSSDIVPAKSLGMKTIMVGPKQGDADVRVDKAVQAIRQVLQWER